MLRILVDRSVRRWSVFCQPTRQQLTEPVAGVLIGCKAARLPDGWLGDEVARIPTIGRLARQGQIQLCTSHELWLEWARGKDFLGRRPGYAFEGCAWEDLKLPVEPSRFWPLFGDELRDKDALRNFCDLLLTTKNLVGLMPSSRHSKLTEFEQNNFKKLYVFKNICHSLARSHLPDAFHLWTAEANGADFFLTLDRSFRNALSTNRRLSISCQVILPAQLLDHLNVVTPDPLPALIPGKFYTLGEAYHLFGVGLTE